MNIKILTVLFSCDRNELLNRTISSFFEHMSKYDKNIKFNFYFVDSGTSNRVNYVKKYSIKNYFFLNPSNPEYTYNMFWSYLHGDFALFLEDDRPFIKSIEKSIIYNNFVEEAILILKKYKIVKGITFKNDYCGNISVKNIVTSLGKHILCIIVNPVENYYYVNGPSVYNIKYLLKTGNFESELHMAKTFRDLKWYTGFTFKGLKCKSNDIFKTSCQRITDHLGIVHSTKGRRVICKNYMY